jgi:AcrR family transcriptional regulator
MAVGEAKTKERLLNAARDLYLEVGPQGFSLREVARRTGLTAPAVYRHYDSKEALLGAVCHEGFRVFGGFLMAALEQPKPLDRLRAAGRQYLCFGLERPRDYRVIFMSEPPGQKPEPTQAPHSTFQFLVDRVVECMEAKLLRKDNPHEVAIGIWAHVHGLTSLRLSGHLAALDDASFAVFFGRSLDRLLAGLAP